MKPATPQAVATCCALIPPPILDAEYPRPNARRLRRLMAFAELTPDTAAELAGISRRSVASYMDDKDPAESLLFSYSIECQVVAVVNQSAPLINPENEKQAIKSASHRGFISPKVAAEMLCKMAICPDIKKGDLLHIHADEKTGRYNIEKPTEEFNAIAVEDLDLSAGIYWNQKTGCVYQQRNQHLVGSLIMLPAKDLK